MSVRGFGSLERRLARLEASLPALGLLFVWEDRTPNGVLYILPDGQQLTETQLQEFIRTRRVGVLVIDDLPRNGEGEEEKKCL